MTVQTDDKQALLERLRAWVGREGEPYVARDAVNEAMIRHWCEVLGDGNPAYTDREAAARTVHGGIVAPPTMLNVWTMRGMEPPLPPERNPQRGVMAELEAAGFMNVVATNCDQEYVRYVRPGERLTAVLSIGSVSEEKTTALGVGHFVETVMTWRDEAGEVVGTQRFRMLKFRPAASAAPASAAPARADLGARARPSMNQDSAFFWEAAREGRLAIQRCTRCGTLRHPPRAGCGSCRSLDWDTIDSAGRGEVYSYTVHHHPPVPGFAMPYVVALVGLDEGVRIVSNLVDVAPEDVRVGMRVAVRFVEVDAELTLPMFAPEA